MNSLNINILNPKALKLLEDLADLDLIEIKSRETIKNEFFTVLSQIRSRKSDLSFEEIQAEVDALRASKKNL